MERWIHIFYQHIVPNGTEALQQSQSEGKNHESIDEIHGNHGNAT
jgi:hypothetical protein